MLTMSCSMSSWVRGRPGRRRSRKVHLSATSSRCRRSRVAGVTMGSRLFRALLPPTLARVARYQRSASVNIIRRRPSRVRRARFSAFRCSICAAACRSSQQAILAEIKAKMDLRLRDMSPWHCQPVRNGNLSLRTLRHVLSHLALRLLRREDPRWLRVKVRSCKYLGQFQVVRQCRHYHYRNRGGASHSQTATLIWRRPTAPRAIPQGLVRHGACGRKLQDGDTHGSTADIAELDLARQIEGLLSKFIRGPYRRGRRSTLTPLCANSSTS